MKPEIKFEEGKLHVKFSVALDIDKDGKPAAMADVALVLSPVEIISEIAKKDLPLLEGILKQIKA